MKVVILAGGLGSRISEESHLKPKPMLEIGEKPILWHIMKIYSHYGFNDFIICLGYKGYVIKEYFAHYFLHACDVTFDFKNKNKRVIHNSVAEPWKVTLVDTGLETMTGGRLKRVQNYIGDQTFMVTYGDGVSDLDIRRLVKYHRAHGKTGTVTSVQPIGRFGALEMGRDNIVEKFSEKPKGDGMWMSGGFFVFEPKIFDYIAGDSTLLEQEPMTSLLQKNGLVAFKHDGFWHPMDTLRDKRFLESAWASGNAPWKLWK